MAVNFIPENKLNIPAKTTKKSFIEKASDFIGATPLAKGIGIGLSQSTPEMKALERRIAMNTASDEELKIYQEILGQAPTNKQIIGSALSLGANFIPGAGKGYKLATKVGISAGTGYAMDVGRNLQNEKSLPGAFKPGIGTAVAASIPVIGALVGKSTSKMTARELEQTSLRLTRTEADNLAKQGKDIAKYISDKKIVGSPEKRYDKISSLYDDMENTIQKRIDNSKIVFNKKDILNSIKEIPDDFVNDPAAVKEVTNKIDDITDVIQNKHGDTISASVINEIKRKTDARAYGKNNTDIVNDSYKAVADNLRKILDDNIPGLEDLNKEYGLIIASKRALFKAINRGQVGILGTLIGYTTGVSAGSAAFGPLGAGIGALVGNKISDVVAGTAARSYAGAGINTVSNVINKIPTDKFGNLQITKKALINLLEQTRK